MPGNSPIFGLGAKDFSITQAGRTANIISVQPLAESLDVPRNIVLVLDNSFSMKERHAIDALLAGVSELLKIVRPIDKVTIVVFENFEKIKINGYDKEVYVRTFQSSNQDELKKFAADAYSNKRITGQTVLFDAMLAGLEFIREAPETEPRFMVVFSDGEDLNSLYKSEDVIKAAQGLKGFNAFAIDYMPDYDTNKFLSGFTSQTRGHIWKAHSETNLVPIFQEVASKMQYYYVVSYLFPPTGNLTAAPSTLKFDEIPHSRRRARHQNRYVRADAAAGGGFCLRHRKVEGRRNQRKGKRGRTCRGRRTRAGADSTASDHGPAGACRRRRPCSADAA